MSLLQFVRKHEKRGPPQRRVVVRYQFRFNRLKKYRVVYDCLHEPILHYAGCETVGANQFPGGFYSRRGPPPFHGAPGFPT
jgi:hypothetical protein